MRRASIESLVEAAQARRPVALVTTLATGEERLVARGEQIAEKDLATTVEEAFRRDKSQVVKLGTVEVFINVFNPPLRMIIIGAVHIAQALIPMAKLAGYDIVVLDPRTAFATSERFAGVTLMPVWPDEALPKIGLDQRTALVTLTHDPKIDEPALKFALAADPFYIGSLGSPRTHAKRVERLRGEGMSDDSIARIHAPIGLDIGAVGAPEIALSIMSEVTAVLRGRDGRRP